MPEVTKIDLAAWQFCNQPTPEHCIIETQARMHREVLCGLIVRLGSYNMHAYFAYLSGVMLAPALQGCQLLTPLLR